MRRKRPIETFEILRNIRMATTYGRHDDMSRDTTDFGLAPNGDKPTLRSLAIATGFSVATISRALADDPRIAAKTRATVAQAALAAGYVPDRAARRLRTGRTQVVTLLLNTEHEFLGFTHEFLSGMTEALRGTGYSVNVVPDHVGEDRLAPVRNILRNHLADGILFTRTEAFDPRVRMLLEADFPFVSHGRTEFSTPHAFVDFDNEAFARTAVERLVAKGRKRLSLILPEDRYTFTQHLRYGFLSAARAAGVDFEIVAGVTLDSSAADIAQAMRDSRNSATPPDGYVCVGEVTALVTLSALSDSGAVLGRDADIFAKRASPIFDNIRPRIDSVYEDLRGTGHKMAEMLLKRMAGEPAAGLTHILSPDFERSDHTATQG